MSRALIILHGHADRLRAARMLADVPDLTMVEFRHAKRTLPMNARMWAMLTDVSRQATHAGQKFTPNDWKTIFTAALRRELRMVPNLTGDGMVLLGERTSEMTKEEHSDLMTLIEAWGAENGVTFSDPTQPKAAIHEAAA